MIIKEVTDESKCCCSCKNNIRIDWPHDEKGCPDCCKVVGGYPYYIATPISVILALPERKVEDEISDN